MGPGQANLFLISVHNAPWNGRAVFCRLRMTEPSADLPIDQKTGKA
jgi:hypothetical protein